MLEQLKEFLGHVLNPDWWLSLNGAMYIVALVIFAETGLFIGFFLPGDSLLLVTGIKLATHPYPFENGFASLILWIVILSICGILGNFVGYWFGKKSGNYLYHRKDTFFYKKKHLYQAKEFYEKRGGATIIFARFVPIVRTFAPIVAGIVGMDFKKFIFYNVIGSMAWVIAFVSIGYIVGENEWVIHNLEKIVIGLILVTTLPVLYKMVFGKHNQNEVPPPSTL